MRMFQPKSLGSAALALDEDAIPDDEVDRSFSQFLRAVEPDWFLDGGWCYEHHPAEVAMRYF